MAHCEYCGAETDNGNLEEIDGAIVRVCDNCRNNPTFGGELCARQIENGADKPAEQPKPVARHSFDPDAAWLAELKQIEKEQETMALVDEKALLEIYNGLERLHNAESKFKARLQDIMERKGVNSLKTKYFAISYTAEHTTTKFDQTAFKKAHPDLFAEFQKNTPVKASVRITLKKEKKGEEEK